MTRFDLWNALAGALRERTQFSDDLEAYRSEQARFLARAGAEALGKEYSGELAYHVRQAMEWSEPRRKKQIKPGCSCGQLADFWLLFYWDVAGAVAGYLNVQLEEAEPWRIWRKIAKARRP